jgi:hypothetical protein
MFMYRPITTRIIISLGMSRSFLTSAHTNEKILAVLYPDPLTGYPPTYPRASIPTISHYPDGMLTPSPKSIDFKPGELLGCVSGELGLWKFLMDGGHEYVVTADKDGDGCEFEHHLRDANYVISQPFYPACLTRQRLEMAPNLKAAITAGVGSDHVDLNAAMDHNVDACREFVSHDDFKFLYGEFKDDVGPGPLHRATCGVSSNCPHRGHSSWS